MVKMYRLKEKDMDQDGRRRIKTEDTAEKTEETEDGETRMTPARRTSMWT
jgi:hypothetical protein